MSRSTKKGPYVDAKLLAKVAAQEAKGTHEPIKTWARSCTIIPDFVGVWGRIAPARPISSSDRS